MVFMLGVQSLAEVWIGETSREVAIGLQRCWRYPTLSRIKRKISNAVCPTKGLTLTSSEGFLCPDSTGCFPPRFQILLLVLFLNF